MANANDNQVIESMMMVSDRLKAEYFRVNSHLIKDDATYWNVLGTLWKLGGTVVEQELWKEMFLAHRKKRHKIMKSRERSFWRKLPKQVTAYRAVNHESEIDTAISWTLSKKVAEQFSQNGERTIACHVFQKEQIFAYFDRRHEHEILVNL